MGDSVKMEIYWRGKYYEAVCASMGVLMEVEGSKVGVEMEVGMELVLRDGMGMGREVGGGGVGRWGGGGWGVGESGGGGLSLWW